MLPWAYNGVICKRLDLLIFSDKDDKPWTPPHVFMFILLYTLTYILKASYSITLSVQIENRNPELSG